MNALDLINAESPIEFDGKKYEVKKANISKVILFQTRFDELLQAKDPALEIKAGAYALYLILKDAMTDLTEDFVLENMAGDLELSEIVETFGFMSRQKMAVAKMLMQAHPPRNVPTPETKPLGTSSSQ